MKTILLVLGACLFAPALCLAQGQYKIPVAVNHIHKDQVGQVCVFALKEMIRGSQAFYLFDYDQCPCKNPRIEVVVFSIDTSENLGYSSAIGYTILLTKDIAQEWLRSDILLCGLKAVEDCAKILLPHIDRAALFMRKVFPT